MKTLGLIGGTTWHSTIEYYRTINQGVQKRLGGTHSARMLLVSVDFTELRELQLVDKSRDYLIETAQKLQQAGAEGLLLCANTLHRYYYDIQEKLDIPILHIADALGEVMKEQDVHRPGILGTTFTMYEYFYHERLKERYGMKSLAPANAFGVELSNAIYEELSLGNVTPKAVGFFQRCITDLENLGADAIVLGCTELYMLMDHINTNLPVFDTLPIHAQSAVEWMTNTNE